MKKILGLDIGTNSIGWALINWDVENFTGNIIDMGSRIIPTDTELLSNYEAGLAASKNATRRRARGSRRLQQRYKLRRQRLIDTLQLLNWLPPTFEAGHHLPVSQTSIAEMQSVFGTEKISSDWVVYYLRHKALTQKVELPELARILYHMNQRRGFRSNRKANSEITSQENEVNEQEGKKKREKKVEVVNVTRIENTGEQLKGTTIFRIYLQDGRSGTIIRKIQPDWEGEMELEITYIPATKKETERFEFRLPDKTDWQKSKEALEKDITAKDLFVGDYFFKELLKNREYRIKERIIDRKYYEAEINEIFATQFKFYPELEHHSAIPSIAEKLYLHNKDKIQELKNNNLAHLFINDIIYYQRPLKSQKGSIAECRYEKKNFRNPDGKWQGIKVAPTSSPSFQEFRIWQTINNIKVLQREFKDPAGHLFLEYDVSAQYLNQQSLEKLFELFDGKEKVTQKQILKELGNLDETKYLVNYYKPDEEKELPGNQTKALLKRVLKRSGLGEEDTKSILQIKETYHLLWHILYSLDQQEHIAKALQKKPFNFGEPIANEVAKAPAFKQQYASLSTKAINKLLPLMRCGKYWSCEAIDQKTLERINKIITGEYDEGISTHTRDLFLKLNVTDISGFQGLQTAMAAYAVYGVHSEKEKVFYDKPEQIQTVAPHELRNPIVTQVVNETLKTVQDIWKTYDRPFEIHIELARELKKNAKERADLSRIMSENERENERITAILRELKWGNPNSLGDIEKLKLWEKQSDEMARESFKEIRFKRPAEPTKDEIQKYRLWCNQKHLSPYSGNIIPISELFTSKFQVDHIIPRSRYFDDSFENKVVVESFLNDEKDNRTAYRYIKEGSAKGYKLFSPAQYEAHVNQFFSRKKRRLLLSEEVPDGFIQRQLNDTKYITRKLNELLSPVAENQQAPIIVTNGSITNELKMRWGLSEKMKEAVKWRFERLQEKTGTELVSYVEEIKNEKPTGKTILRLEGYEKRIDHRHHALDALVIACTTRSHIKYLNTLNAQRDDNFLKQELSFLLDKAEKGTTGVYKFRQPWNRFVIDTELALRNIVVSFKNRIHIFGKRKNAYIKYIQRTDGTWEKEWQEQKEKKSTYVRKPISAPMPFGIINLHFENVDVAKALKNPERICNSELRIYIKAKLSEFNNDVKATALFLKNDKPKINYERKLSKVDYYIEPTLQKIELWKAFYIPETIVEVALQGLVIECVNKSSGNLEQALKRYCEYKKIQDSSKAQYSLVDVLAKNIVATKKVSIGKDFTHDKIDGLPDRKLAAILHNHLETFEIDGKKGGSIAFESEGLEALYKILGKRINKISVYEIIGEKYPVNMKAVQSETGTNLYMAIYQKIGEPGKRVYMSIPLRDVIEAKANGDGVFVEEKEGYKHFLLSPNDLVYMPDENENIDIIDWKKDRQKIANKIYKLVSVNKGQAFFVPQTLAKVIQDKVEFDSLNKVERSLDGRMIKQYCIKLKTNRLGHVGLA